MLPLAFMPMQRPGQGGTPLVDKVTWQRVGRVTEPGRYMFAYGWVTVTADDLAIWKQFPNASFALVRLPSAEDEAEFHLGAFDPGEDVAQPE